jgi:transcription elongation factor Elf1
MEKPIYSVGDRVEKLCLVCNEERGHVVASITKKGNVSRVTCPKCGTRSAFKSSAGVSSSETHAKTASPYDRTRTYKAGQMMLHPTYGMGEVTALIEPQKIDVLFSDKIRRLIHGRVIAQSSVSA